MANPQSQIPSAQLPYPDTVVTNQDGTPTLLFHRFLTGVWQRTGGAAGIGSSDVQAIATQALTTANRALTEANAADSSANQAQATANSARSLASTANTNASSALSIASSAYTGALLKANNLTDLGNVATARANLGLASYPAVFTFDTCPGSLSKAVPLMRSYTLPPNFAGVVLWWGVAATADAIFHIGRSRGPSSTITPIGTINVVHAGSGFMASTQAAVSLSAGDSLVITAPASPDATLAQLSFTFPLTLA